MASTPTSLQASPRFDARAIVLAWCVWLIGMWLLLVLTIGANPLAYRWMVFAAAIGLMGLWPAARLSQDHRGPGARSVLLVDWFCMLVVFQAIVWPMCLVAGWSLEQALLVNAAVASWSLLTGLFIAWGRSFHTARMRTAAMLACVGVVLLEPLSFGLLAMLQATLAEPVALTASDAAPAPTPAFAWTHFPNLRVSPVQTLWSLTGPPALYQPRPWADYIVGIAAAALVGWCVLAALVPRKSAQPDPPPTRPPSTASTASTPSP